MAKDRHLYRVSRFGFDRDRVTIGTRTAASATVGYVKSQNEYYARYEMSVHRAMPRISCKIERGPEIIDDLFEDVTDEFFPTDASGASPA